MARVSSNVKKSRLNFQFHMPTALRWRPPWGWRRRSSPVILISKRRFSWLRWNGSECVFSLIQTVCLMCCGRENHGRPWMLDGSRPICRLRLSQDLTDRPFCNTLSYMKTTTLTIRLDESLDKLLSKAARQSGKNRSEIAREALRRQLRISQFEALRRRIMPFAEARGYLSDEDVFRDVS